MPTASESAVAFNLELGRCRTLAECRDLFAKTIQPFGYDAFACSEIDLDVRQRSAIYMMNWPEDWRHFVFASNWVEHCPVVNELKNRHRPFQWSDLPADREIGKVEREAMKLFRQFNWIGGFCVPLRRGENRYGYVSLHSGSKRTPPDVRDALAMMATCLYEKARRLAPQLGAHLQLAGLTLREMDSLRLVARGLSDREIGERLTIAPATAHEYVERAKRKLKAGSRAELVGIAVSMGLVEN